MWEQFSYFGMRALLVYYMTKQLMLGQATSSLIYCTSGSLSAGLVGTLWSRMSSGTYFLLLAALAAVAAVLLRLLDRHGAISFPPKYPEMINIL